MIRPLPLAAALAGAFLLAGCVSLSDAPPEEIVARRAQARWDAVIANDWKTAWNYTTPAFRARFTAENYAGLIGGHVQRNGVEVLKVACTRPEEQTQPQEQEEPAPPGEQPPPVEITACIATIRLRHVLPIARDAGEISTNFPERWVKDEDGKWYIYHSEAAR